MLWPQRCWGSSWDSGGWWGQKAPHDCYPSASVTHPPLLQCAHRKAHLPGRGHGPHGTLPLLDLHPSELLPTPAGASCWHRYHPQDLRLWQHSPNLWALPGAPLSAPYWVQKKPSENGALPRCTSPKSLSTTLREGTVTTAVGHGSARVTWKHAV